MSRKIKEAINWNWDKEKGICVCQIFDNTGKIYTGTSYCHPDDKDMQSEKTGGHIAFLRAKIELLRAYRDEIKHELGALKQLYYSMNRSKYFNPKSYENKMLQRQIRMKEFDLDTAKDMITMELHNLQSFLTEKEKLYRRLRFNRKVNSEQQ